MSGDLFRSEAVDFAARRLSGEVIVASPLSTRLLTLVALVAVAGAALFLATATYARKETVQGVLSPSQGLVRVTATNGGLVERIWVSEGQEVGAGSPLVTLRLSQDGPTGDVGAGLSEQLTDEQAASADRYAARLGLLTSERHRVSDDLKAVRAQLTQVDRQVSLQRQQAKIAAAEVERSESIAAKGYLPLREVERRRREALTAQQAVAELLATRIGLEREVVTLEGRLRAIPVEIAAVEAEARETRAVLGQRVLEAGGQTTNVLRAPTTGRVVALPIASSQTLKPGSVALLMTPRGSTMAAELYAPSRAAGLVRPGQEVRLRYAAFPQQKFGTGRGRVRSVSRTLMAPSDLSLPGITVDEPVFRILVTLERESVDAYGTVILLQPGMLVSADIVLERQTLLEWLLDPLYAVGRRA